MTYKEFIDELAAAKISGRDFARMLRLNENTIANYKSRGSIPSNLAVIAVLMRTLSDHEIQFRESIEALDIQPNARRGRSIRDV